MLMAKETTGTFTVNPRRVFLCLSHFALGRHQPHVLTLNTILGSIRCKDPYNYEDDQSHPQTSGTLCKLRRVRRLNTGRRVPYLEWALKLRTEFACIDRERGIR